MSLILHIFKKDLRRLRWYIALAMVLLTVVARWSFEPSVEYLESWSILLMLLMWVCLIGLSVEQDPLVGDRDFWMTRPYRWRDLLIAKALFAVAVIHLPFFLAQAVALTARGFTPGEYLGDLAVRQLVLAAVLTLPSLALATLVGSFTHFMLVVSSASALAVMFGMNSMVRFGIPTYPVLLVRSAVVAAALGFGAIVVIAIQYSRKAVWVSRGLAILFTLAVLVCGAISPETAFALRSAWNPEALNPRFELGSGPTPTPPYREPPETVSVDVPVHLNGIPKGVQYRVVIRRQWLDSEGERIPLLYAAEFEPTPTSDLDWVLRFRMDARTFEALKRSHPAVSGIVGLEFFRYLEGAPLAPGSIGTPVPAAGRCSVREGKNQASIFRVTNLFYVLIECSSPAVNPGSVKVQLTGVRNPHQDYPLDKFLVRSTQIPAGLLSPFTDTRLLLTVSDEPKSGFISVDDLPNLRVVFKPEIVTGYKTVRFRFADLDLEKYRRITP